MYNTKIMEIRPCSPSLARRQFALHLSVANYGIIVTDDSEATMGHSSVELRNDESHFALPVMLKRTMKLGDSMDDLLHVAL